MAVRRPKKTAMTAAPAGTLTSPVGHVRQIQQLQRAIGRGKLPHALLFHGPSGVGKHTVSRWLAAALLCATPQDGAPCLTCTSCLKAAHNTHPDLLEPGRNDRGKVDVDAIRDLCDRLSFLPAEAERRVVILDDADRLNVTCQNALLKTLEEPPSRAVLFLIARKAGGLLPTVRSRSLVVHFGPLSLEDTAAVLVTRGLPEADARRRAALAHGRPGVATGPRVEACERLAEELARFLGAPADLLATLAFAEAQARSLKKDAGKSDDDADPGALDASEGKGIQNLEEWLEGVAPILRDMAMGRRDTPHDLLLDPRLADAFAGAATAPSFQQLMAMWSQVAWLQSVLQHNPAPQLAIESVFTPRLPSPRPRR